MNSDNSSNGEVVDPVTDESSTESASAESDTEATTTEQEPEVEYVPIEVTIRSLLEAGAHFGHRTERWNPKMINYIFGERKGVHIINLDKTLDAWTKASKFIGDLVSRGGTVLFVGTKPAAHKIVRDAARRCESYYVNKRWLGGTLSNFQTIKNTIRRMNSLEEVLEKASQPDSDVKMGKKERLGISKQLKKLEANIGGIREMKRLPDVIFMVDIIKDSIAVNEANKLGIPVVALVDTNTNPSRIKFPIPANDDAPRTISLLVNGVADVVLQGKQDYEAQMQAMAEAQALAQKQKAEKPEEPMPEAKTEEEEVELKESAPAS